MFSQMRSVSLRDHCVPFAMDRGSPWKDALPSFASYQESWGQRQTVDKTYFPSQALLCSFCVRSSYCVDLLGWCTHQSPRMEEVRVQLGAVGALLLSCESRESNSGHQVCQEVPLPAEPSHWLCFCLDFGVRFSLRSPGWPYTLKLLASAF